MNPRARSLLLAASAMAALLMAPALSAEMTAGEKEVWQMEENYWRYAQAFQLEAYRSLWHEDFIGWPSSEAKPVGKAGITEWLEGAREKRQTMRYELRREAVRVFGNVAVAHYAVNRTFSDPAGKSEGGWYKITHTWMKVDGQWKIITGMSAPLPAAQQ